MNKIPVGQSIGGAYGFLFGRILTIAGLSWLPAAFYAAARLHFVQYTVPQIVAAAHGQAMPPQAHLLPLLFFLFSLLLICAISIALTREALGMGGEPVFAQIIVGGKELRLLLGFVRFTILMIVLIVTLSVGVGVAAIAAQSALAAQTSLPAQAQQWVVLLAVALAIAAVLFVSLRLTFLLAPVTVIEGRARLARAWELSEGNFLRMLAIFLACVLPVFAILLVVEYALLGPQLLAMAHVFMSSRDPSAILQLSEDRLLPLMVVATVGLVVLNALFAGASAVAYRALAGTPQPQEPEEEDMEPVMTDPGHEDVSEQAHDLAQPPALEVAQEQGHDDEKSPPPQPNDEPVPADARQNDDHKPDAGQTPPDAADHAVTDEDDAHKDEGQSNSNDGDDHKPAPDAGQTPASDHAGMDADSHEEDAHKDEDHPDSHDGGKPAPDAGHDDSGKAPDVADHAVRDADARKDEGHSESHDGGDPPAGQH